MLVPQVLQVWQDGIQLHMETGAQESCHRAGWHRGGSVLGGDGDSPWHPLGFRVWS